MLACVDDSGRGRELDAADPGPGYYSLGGFGAGAHVSAFLPIWTAGAKPRYCPEGTGYMLPKGADILIQVHYHKTGKPETDATASASISPRQAARPPGSYRLCVPQRLARSRAERGTQDRVCTRRPASVAGPDAVLRERGGHSRRHANYEVRGSTQPVPGVMNRPLDRDILITSVMPHMHWLGKDFTFTAVLPDGKTSIPLIKIDHWNFNWQGTYALQGANPRAQGLLVRDGGAFR